MTRETDIWAIAPSEIVQQKDDDRAERDPLFRFLSDPEQVTKKLSAGTFALQINST